MEFNPKVSIVIPVYNGSNYMSEAIDSALAQTYKNTEVIVVNDGSNDGGKTEEIAKSYGNKIRYFYKTNGGVSTALNLGITKMKGEYFSWLSHDDIYNPNKIKIQIRLMKEIDRYDVVLYSDSKIYYENLKITKERKSKQYEQSKIRFRLITMAIINACTLLIPRICFEKIGLFDEKQKMTQDADMIFRLSEKFDFYYIPKTLITIRKHPEQPRHTYNNMNKALSDFYIACLRKISANDLLEMSGEDSIALVYAKLAWNYREKRYYDAFSYAKELSNQYIKENNDLEAKKILNKLNYYENKKKKDNAFKKNSNKYLKLGVKNIRIKFNRIRALKFFVLSIVWFPLNIKAWEYFVILFLPKKFISKIFEKSKARENLYYSEIK